MQHTVVYGAKFFLFKGQMKTKLFSILMFSVLACSPFSLLLAESCDEVCARAGEPGYNHADDQGTDTVCCCQKDENAGQQVNRPQSECEGNNPESPSQPSED